MGYFSNGSEADCYEAEYCQRCIHGQGEFGAACCAVVQAHLEHNYTECNNPKSILHILIPRKSDGFNDRCRMFVEVNQ